MEPIVPASSRDRTKLRIWQGERPLFWMERAQGHCVGAPPSPSKTGVNALVWAPAWRAATRAAPTKTGALGVPVMLAHGFKVGARPDKTVGNPLPRYCHAGARPPDFGRERAVACRGQTQRRVS